MEKVKIRNTNIKEIKGSIIIAELYVWNGEPKRVAWGFGILWFYSDMDVLLLYGYILKCFSCLDMLIKICNVKRGSVANLVGYSVSFRNL